MVFARQLEVKQCNGDESSDNDQQTECHEEDSKKSVDLVAPHRSKDVVELDVNRREGQESSNKNLEDAASIPGNLRGNLSGHLCGSGWRVKVGWCVVLRQHRSEDSQWERNKDVEGVDGQKSREWESTSRSVCNGNGVDPHKDESDWTREKTCGD